MTPQGIFPGMGLAEKLAERLLGPAVDKLAKKGSEYAQIAWHQIFNAFDEYLERSFERYSYFTSVVFPNAKKLLRDYYVPLTLVDAEEKDRATIEQYPKALIDTEKDVLIVDTAGMGKSTLLRYMFLAAIRESIGIPVMIELRKLKRNKTPIQYLLEQLQDIKGDFPEALLYRLIQEGGFIFFLDGYDEIDEEDLDAVSAALQEFKAKANKNKFVMTSRDQKGLASFPEYRRFSIRPLNTNEAFVLIRRYAPTEEFAKELIGKLRQQENATAVEEFLTNPLLVSLLFKSYEHKQTIPLRKHIFYRQVYESLFETHDLTKEGAYQRDKKSGLDIDQFHTMMRSLGIITVKATKLEYDTDELIAFVRQAQQLSSSSAFTASDFISDIVLAVPLFVRDGNYLRWAHKSIQEYFAAAYICFDSKAQQETLLRQMHDSRTFDRFTNVLALCYDIDTKTFRRTVLRDILLAIVKEADSCYLWTSGLLPQNVVTQRKALTVLNKAVLVRNKNVSHDEPGKIHAEAEKVLRAAYPDFVRSRSRRTVRETTIVFFEHRSWRLIEALKYHDDFSFVRPVFGIGQIKENLPGEPDEYMMALTDSPSLFANDVANFAEINNRLSHTAESSIDIDRAKSILADIDTQIAQEKELDLTF